MGLVDRFERKLETTVGDAFARVFGGSIAPPEVEAALQREAESGAHDVGGGRILAPNEYVITLSYTDFEKVNADPDLTPSAFAKHLEGFVHERGWQTYGEVVVRFEPSPGLHTGQFRVHGAVNRAAHHAAARTRNDQCPHDTDDRGEHDRAADDGDQDPHGLHPGSVPDQPP